MYLSYLKIKMCLNIPLPIGLMWALILVSHCEIHGTKTVCAHWFAVVFFVFEGFKYVFNLAICNIQKVPEMFKRNIPIIYKQQNFIIICRS
jgi:hypothetical protein